MIEIFASQSRDLNSIPLESDLKQFQIYIHIYSCWSLLDAQHLLKSKEYRSFEEAEDAFIR